MEPMQAMQGIIQKALKACAAREYFTQAQKKERNLRQLFQNMRDVLREDKSGGTGREQALAGFRLLNGFYKTRAPLKNAELFIVTLLEELKNRNWLNSDPPALLADAVDTASANLISDVVPVVLTDFTAKGGRHEYSLLTKFLHFTYPETFPIYDAQVMRSVQEWAYFSFREKCKWDEVGEIAKLDGSGYKHLQEFYRQFWTVASPDGQARLREVAKQMEVIVGSKVGVLDLLDKHLWIANGNPVRLGLLA